MSDHSDLRPRRQRRPLGLLGALALLLFAAPTLAAPAARPLTYDRPITQADLEGRTLRELTLLRNYPFARAGNVFRKRWLRDYFTQFPWYKPTGLDEKKLSALDRQNAEAAFKYEAALPRAELEARRQALVKARSRSDEDAIELMLLSRALGRSLPPAVRALGQDLTPLDDPGQLDQVLEVAQLKDLSRRDLRLLRNMVYARRGRPFKSPLLQAYFARMEWYQPDPGYKESRLTAIDQRNIKIVLSLENQLGGRLTEHEHQVEDGWLIEA